MKNKAYKKCANFFGPPCRSHMQYQMSRALSFTLKNDDKIRKWLTFWVTLYIAYIKMKS